MLRKIISYNTYSVTSPVSQPFYKISSSKVNDRSFIVIEFSITKSDITRYHDFEKFAMKRGWLAPRATKEEKEIHLIDYGAEKFLSTSFSPRKKKNSSHFRRSVKAFA